MHAAITHWFEQRWYGQRAPGVVLRLLARLFAGVASARRRRYLAERFDHAAPWPARAGVPVIVVGNLAVGGVGKTPLVLALVKALRARGWQPGVISRGYGRHGHAVLRVNAGSSSTHVGDEPLLIARRSGVPVAVAARRIEAARLLVDSGEVDVLIADDGLQHYGLMRDIEILVIDGQRRFGNGLMLPAGPLREPIERAAACDFIVCNGGTPQAGELAMQLELGEAVAVSGQGESRPLASFAQTPVHAVAGIGNPGRFFKALRDRGVVLIEHAFADHHPFVAGDFDFADDAPVLMTEKDAVKCEAFAQPNWYAVPVEAELPQAFFEDLVKRLANFPRRSP